MVRLSSTVASTTCTGLPSRRSAICWKAQACLSSIAHSTSFSARRLIFLRFSLSFGSIRFSSRRSASVNIFSPDLPPGLPEMPFLNAIASTPYSIGETEYFAVGSVHAVGGRPISSSNSPPILEAGHRCTRPGRVGAFAPTCRRKYSIPLVRTAPTRVCKNKLVRCCILSTHHVYHRPPAALLCAYSRSPSLPNIPNICSPSACPQPNEQNRTL